ncbi:MAG: hypothetical protein J4F28_01345 [Nitrosopumilaceae archaeon]|nr:hypothetical protein [Nitrosopumilaceae archaeon]
MAARGATDFNEFRSRLSAELGSAEPFKTMHQSRAFEAAMAGDYAVAAIPGSSASPRNVPMS